MRTGQTPTRNRIDQDRRFKEGATISPVSQKQIGQARIPVLDGWRGISILLVLIGHMLPLGPKFLNLNSMVSAAGLSIFFFLSGFLVVSILKRGEPIPAFFIKRFFRILPLAWLVLIIVLISRDEPAKVWVANLLFYANVDSSSLIPHADHLWSLSLEVQFYIAVGVLVAVFGRAGLFALPALCILVTVARIVYGRGVSIDTWFRCDEILVGGCAALWHGERYFKQLFERNWTVVGSGSMIVLLFLSCHFDLLWLNFFRPYVTAWAVCSTLYRANPTIERILISKTLKYLASVSYALYVIHPLTYSGWLTDADVTRKYIKRLLSIVITFAIAHFETKYYERYWNDLARRITSRYKSKVDRLAAEVQPRLASE